MNRFQERVSRSIDNLRFSQIEDRLQKLEAKTFPQKRTPTNLSQQMLLLNELGLLKELQKLNLSANKLAELLSALLNADKDNIRKALTKINLKDSELRTSQNYAFLHQIYENAGLKELSAQADKEYTRLENSKTK